MLGHISKRCSLVFLGLLQTDQAISAVISNLLLKSGIQGNKYGTVRIYLIVKIRMERGFRIDHLSAI